MLVWGTVPYYLKLRGFSWKHGIGHFAPKKVLVIVSRHIRTRIYLSSLPTHLNRDNHRPAGIIYPSPSPHRSNTKYWSINQFSIDYAFRPRLRNRLTLRRLALRRKPWAFGVRVFHPHYRYSCQHSHFRYLQQTSRFTFTGLRNAPLPCNKLHPQFRYTA